MASSKSDENFIIRPFWFLVVVMGLITILGNLTSTSAQKVMCRPPEATMGTTVGALAHIGSAPPDCTSKCGTCAPCVPVQVEECDPSAYSGYYAMAWGCACNDQLMWPWHEGTPEPPPGPPALPGPGQGAISAGKPTPDVVVQRAKKPKEGKKGRKHKKHRKHKKSRKMAPGSGK